MSSPRERAERVIRDGVYPLGWLDAEALARDLLAALDRVEELERALAEIENIDAHAGLPSRTALQVCRDKAGAALASAAASEGETA